MVSINMHALLLFMGTVAQSYSFLRADFIGISVSPTGVGIFLTSFIATGYLVVLLFLLGYKVCTWLPSGTNTKTYTSFLPLVFGYILVGTGVALIGMLSLLTAPVMWLYLLCLTIVAVFPIPIFLSGLQELRQLLSVPVLNPKAKRSIIDVFIAVFICIAFLRLIVPEAGVDAIAEHLSYPKEYLLQHSLMIQPLGAFYTATIPQLGQMLYVITQSLGLSQAAPMVHFLFYVLSLILLYKWGDERNRAGRVAALLLATAPIVIKETSTAYVDFQWIFCWLVAIWVATAEKLTAETIVLSSIAFGATLATKPQALFFMPVFLLYILLKATSGHLLHRLRSAGLFFLGALAIVGIWYVRAYIITGNPFHPAFSHDFSIGGLLPSHVSSFTAFIQRIKGLFELSPLALASAVVLVVVSGHKVMKRVAQHASLGHHLGESIRKRLQHPTDLGLFSFILLIEYSFLPVAFSMGRYLLYGYLPLLVLLAPYTKSAYNSSKLGRYFAAGIVIILLGYYIVQTALVLPYGFGWADQNRYLTRILSRDNSSYYDYDRQFSREITSNDLVGVYGVYGLYYADFRYRDVAYILRDGKNSFASLRHAGVTKLLLRGGDMDWFCKQVGATDCAPKHYPLVAHYDAALQYVYSLE